MPNNNNEPQKPLREDNPGQQPDREKRPEKAGQEKSDKGSCGC